MRGALFENVRVGAVALFLITLAGGGAEVSARGVTTSTIVGRVVDENGQPVGCAQVVVVNTATGTQNGVLTRDDGRFFLPDLRPGGPYRVEAQMVGRATDVVKGLELRLNETEEVRLVLPTEAVVEGLEVSAERGLGIVQNTGVSTTIGEDDVFERLISDFCTYSARWQMQLGVRYTF